MSVPEQSKKRDYSHYDQMSTAELEQILRLDFQASDESGSDLDAILYIADLLAKRNGPSDPDAAWERFQTQYRPCADGRSLYDWDDSGDTPASAEQTSPTSVRPRRWRRLAVLAAVLAALLLGGMAAQAAGVDLFGAFAMWTDETFHFVPANPNDASNAGTDPEPSTQQQSILQAAGLDGLFPTWCPEGFSPGAVKITELYDSISANMSYFGEDRNYSVTIIQYMQPQTSVGTFEKDDTPVEEYVHNGWTFYILSNLDTLTATAYDGTYMIMLSGALTREEIKAIIDSIPFSQHDQNRERIQNSLAKEGLSLYCPKIPLGFVPCQSTFFKDQVTNFIHWSQLYVRGEENLVFGLFIGDSDTIYEKDDTPVEEYVYHDVTHYIFSNRGSTTVTWLMGDINYYMTVTDGALDIKALIRSIYEPQ